MIVTSGSAVGRWAAACRPPTAGAPCRSAALARPRNRTRAAATGDDGSSGDTNNEDELQSLAALRARAERLNDLFYGASEAPPGTSDDVDGSAAADQAAPSEAPGEQASPLLLPDLPLWRVQWAALPGSFEVLHVHVPHYTSMFSRLLRGPRPWRYGSLYLPEGSKNLGSDEYALEPGTKAPLAGTLMEVLQAVRFVDGRVLILAMGVGRIAVRRCTQALPYCRADVELLIDPEDQAAFEPLALQALDSAAGGQPDVPMLALMEAVPAAARAAAAAYQQAWCEYELADVRQEGGGEAAVIDGGLPEEAQRMGRRLAAIAGNEVLQLPYFEAIQSAAQAASAPGMADLLGSQQEAAAILQAAVDEQRPVLRRAEAGAYAAASAAAVRSVELALQRLGVSSSSSDAALAAADGAAAVPAAGPPPLNSAAERGLEVQGAEDFLGEDALEGQPVSLELALQLEAAVWQEVDAVHALASKLRDRAQPLPAGLACLRPPQQQQQQQREDVPQVQQQAVAPPDYPALRRLHYLANATTSMLANVGTEGRQALVEAGSLCGRLRLGLAGLRKHRQVLAAVVAVEGLD